MLLLVLALLAGGVVGWVLLVRPGLDDYSQRLLRASPPQQVGLKATWFGTTAVLLSDGEHAIFIDPFLTRPEGLLNLLRNREIAPDEARIADALVQARARKLDAVVVSHSHYDHAMDAGVTARVSGAMLIGSASTANVGRGAGVPEAQIRSVRGGDRVSAGPFTITFIDSRHAGATGGRPRGEIEAPLRPPARYFDYREGGSFSLLIEHPYGTVLHHGSAGFVPGALRGRRADLVFLGIALRDDLDAYLRETVDAVGATRVIPTHWDDFTRSLDAPLVPGPFGVDLDGFFADFARLRPDIAVHTLAPRIPALLFAKAQTMPSLDPIAQKYVQLVLALGEHDSGYVDAYYGPAAWREQAKREAKPLATILAEAQALLAATPLETPPADALAALRREYLQRQLAALVAHARRLAGEKFSFDQEAQALYDVAPPHYTESDFAPQLERLETLVPAGAGTLAERYNRYIESFAVPADRLEAVMQAAIAEARRRTLQHIALPAGESFELKLVSGKPWSAYNWYQGNFRSLIEVNTDLPVTANRVIDLAVHEGYPGHHVYNALLEAHLVRERGWPEYQVYPLYSPQSLIAEGTADFGIEVAFPRAERLAFLREVIFPAAGLDPAQAQQYLEVTQAAEGLDGATIEAARRYRDGAFDQQQAMDFMQRHALSSAERARQRIAFFDALGAYIVNYSLGEALVREYIERQLDGADDPNRRWVLFRELISSPRLPSGIQ